MKTLITADTIYGAQKNGQTVLSYSLANSIVTPEAKTIAKELGINLIEEGRQGVATNPSGSDASEREIAHIKATVLSQLKGHAVPPELLDQLVRKMANEQKLSTTGTSAEGLGANQPIFTTAQGIKRIRGNQLPMGIMEEAGKEKQIGLLDVVTSADSNSPIAAGYMGWTNCFFPWTLNYDEVDVILEGELHIRCGGETSIAKVGDVIFIPKGSSIEFGTPTSVKFVFVAHPANWQEV